VRTKRREFRNSEHRSVALEVANRRKGKPMRPNRDARARLAMDDGGDDFVQRPSSQEVIRFAPNFTVYVLPPNVVCLYSEDRKFFLHGELYCSLASAIGAGQKCQSIIRKLEEKFPSAKVHEALQRLLDRRFVTLNSRSSDVTAAYWATLGLSPEIAEANLQKLRVRIKSIDVRGAKELTAALRELGVRVTQRVADLIVILVNDYLEEGLAELNQRHLSNSTPWLLAQPSGIFPLVGPVFRPGKGACWSCLAERMRRNREVKAFIDRTGAKCIAASPLARDTFGQSGIQLAALEIAKAIATDFRTDLKDHIISLDLLGSTVAKHYVAARPQCPTCGCRELRDPGRAPKPIQLGSGGKLIMTSGGYRSTGPSSTVERFRKHVSPLTGVVSRLDRIKADLPLNTNYFATHNYAPRPETVQELKAGLSGGSFGKGSTANQGEASALMEAIERYSGSFQGDEIRVTRRLTDFQAGEAIHPNDLMLFSETQYGRDAVPTISPNQAKAMLTPFVQSAEIEWSPVWSLRDERFKYVPTSLLYFFYKGPGADSASPADSNGCAAGNTLEEAIVQGFLELVERDSYAIWWYNRLQRPQVDLSQFDDPYVREIQKQFTEAGRRVWVLDVTSDLGIPSFVAVMHWTEGSQEQIEFGSGAHFDARIALLRALTELNQFLSIGLVGCRSAGKLWGYSGFSEIQLGEQPYLTPSGMSRSDFGLTFGMLDGGEQAMTCVRLARRLGLDFLVLDQTRPDIEVPVVRVMVPGLRHFYRRFAPGRLYDVPVKLGLRERPLSEDELNPLHPRT
jgi:bacteriocin biosynthesis cyclodehydratase domain-containing protein